MNRLFFLMPVALLLTIAACMYPAPKMSKGKIVSDENGDSLFDDYASKARAKERIEEALDSKGFVRYKIDAGLIIAKQWISVSKYAVPLTLIFCLLWYFTHWKEWGGAAVICLLFSLLSVFMAGLVTSLAGKIVIGIVTVAIIGLGIWARNKSVIQAIKKRRSQKNGKQKNPSSEESVEPVDNCERSGSVTDLPSDSGDK